MSRSRIVKQCSRCREYKGVTEFDRNRHAGDGSYSYCKPCKRAYLARRESIPCTVDGCGRRQWTREMCNLHYQRWQRNGDPGEPAPLGADATPRKNDTDPQRVRALVAQVSVLIEELRSLTDEEGAA